MIIVSTVKLRTTMTKTTEDKVNRLTDSAYRVAFIVCTEVHKKLKKAKAIKMHQVISNAAGAFYNSMKSPEDEEKFITAVTAAATEGIYFN